MTYIRIVMAPGLLTRAQSALGKTQESLGAMLGVSRKTMGRWQAGRGNPSIQQWAQIAVHVHAVNPALAETIAAEMGESLASLGIVAASPLQSAPALPPGARARQGVTTGDLVDSIVCAAAEAVAATPQYIRPALLAAFDRAASVDLAVDEVRTTLRAAFGDKADTKKKKGA
jgi:DNA-binding XRE family transcriptional regulator